MDDLLGLFSTQSEQAWSTAYLSLISRYGFEQTVYGVLPDRKTPLENAFLRSNYAPRWRSKYDEEKFHYIDPTVSHCLSSTLPIVWSAATFNGDGQQEFYEEACSYNIRSGITYPIHGANGEFGVISFVTDRLTNKQFQGELDYLLPDLALMRDYIFESSLQFAWEDKSRTDKISLTKKERECLKWAMAGKSSWDISIIMNCSEATVNFHFANMRRKFKVKSRQQVIIRAIRNDLVDPDY